jgi:hypothetical protein
VPMYANVEEKELAQKCQDAFPEDPRSHRQHTSVSAALHVVYCRQIQSEILNITLHRDFAIQFQTSYEWRLRILEKLDHWKSLCQRFANLHSDSYTSNDWLYMIYNFSLTMLYCPTRKSGGEPAAEWTLKACIQACLTFRKLQRFGSISEPWMGLIQQFKCGVALLYCFFITPPHLRSDSFSSSDAGEAVRACSIILSILAERWS